jgi:hypothetical protein
MATILKPGDYSWRETPGGTGWALLRHDRARATQTRLLRYAPTTVVPAALLDHTVEWLLTRGEARCGDLELHRGGYFCWPRGHRRPAIVPGTDGYTVLSIVYGPTSPVQKSLLAIPDATTRPWGTEGDGTDGTGPETQELSQDPTTGAATELWRLQPGIRFSLPPATTVQELYLVRGSLRWEGERLPLTSYLAFAPGNDRGAFEAVDQPALLFVHTHPQLPAAPER